MGLLVLARAAVELAKTKVAVGDERAHAVRPGECQRLPVVGRAPFGIEPVGMGRDVAEQARAMSRVDVVTLATNAADDFGASCASSSAPAAALIHAAKNARETIPIVMRRSREKKNSRQGPPDKTAKTPPRVSSVTGPPPGSGSAVARSLWSWSRA